MISVTESDISLVRDLEKRSYKKTMNGVVSEEDQERFRSLKRRLEKLANLYKEKYDLVAGKFTSEIATGNPISFHGKLRRVWSGIYKGSENKQYSAQISFVINSVDNCLDVGFYFGRASSINVDKEVRKRWELELKELGKLLFNEIEINSELRRNYFSLFEFGFKPEIKGRRVASEEWVQNLQKDPTHSSIVFNLKPDHNGEIEFSSVDLYVAMLLPLIGVLPEQISNRIANATRKIKSLSPEQRARQAEKRALIGLDGEKFVMNLEKERINSWGLIETKLHPIHKSLISDSFGYDILSFDRDLNEIFIEVKTTTLTKGDKGANTFFLSAQEYKFYEENIDKYRLYRVYDIYGSPWHEILDLSKITKYVDGYRFEIA